MTLHAFQARFRRNFWAGILFLSLLPIYLLLEYLGPAPEYLKHLVLTLTAVIGVHLLDRWYLFRDTQEALAADMLEIQKGIIQDTKQALDRVETKITTGIRQEVSALIGAATSLEAMTESGITQVYSDREKAAKDMKRDLIDPNTTKISIIGISLNDFTQGHQQTLREAWEEIEKVVKDRINDKSDRNKLDIRLLIIDPNCLGARLRSQGESRRLDAIQTRLMDDVTASAKKFYQLQKELIEKNENGTSNGGVTLECKLYRVPPILFLCQTDKVSYVQQYHFWSSRAMNTPIPILRYAHSMDPSSAYDIHNEMESHFDWVWRHASISVSDFLSKGSIGSDMGTYQCGIVNVYTDPLNGSARMKYLLENAKVRVWIQGISLRSFFDEGALTQEMARLVEEGEVPIKVLLIDPICRQAKYRSYREQLFGKPDLGFEDYTRDDHEHLQSKLCRDTNSSIEQIKKRITDTVKQNPDGWIPKLELRKYNCAPSCFMLLVDNTVLVEQYHYGKVTPEEDRGRLPTVLGKDMPLVEYSQFDPTTSSLFYDHNSLREPYSLFEDHFTFVFNHSEEVKLIQSVLSQ